jgi:hypothetical protein
MLLGNIRQPNLQYKDRKAIPRSRFAIAGLY